MMKKLFTLLRRWFDPSREGSPYDEPRGEVIPIRQFDMKAFKKSHFETPREMEVKL